MVLIILHHRFWKLGVLALTACLPTLPLCAAGAPTPPATLEQPAITMDAFLDAIAQVETGGHDFVVGKHGERGRYQFRESTWRMHTTVDFHFAHDRLMSDLVAREHCRYLYAGLQQHGVTPTPYNLAACWNAGLRGGMRRPLPKSVDDYATRVSNLCLAR